MESSDRDGGSSVAVLTYLRCIIETIDHPELVRLTFDYLLAIPEAKTEKAPARPTALARRRRSQSLLASLATGDEQPIPSLFNLNDLVLGNLGSNNQQTLTAVLKLVSTMLRSHNQYDVSIIKLGRSDGRLFLRSLQSHMRNTESLFSMIETLTDDSHLKDMYNLHLEDAQNVLEAHPCSLQLLRLPDAEGIPSVSRVDESSSKPIHASDDAVLNGLLSLLEDFFINDIETNLSLTQVFSSVVSCSKQRLDGWFLESTNGRATSLDKKAQITSEEADVPQHGSDKSDSPNGDSLPLNRQLPTTPLLAALAGLVDQIAAFRQSMENFDIYLTERRHLFKVSDESETSARGDLHHIKQNLDVDQTESPQSRNAPRIGSISERLKSETSTASVSRSHSPRGRNPEAPSPPVLVGRLSHLRRSPSRSPAKSGSRAISPSPLRKEVSTDSPIQQPSTPMGPPDALSQKVRLKVKRQSGIDISDVRSETSSVRSEDAGGGGQVKEVYKEVTLSHVLTNVIILQEFMMELVAMVQVRARMFGEVKFD